MRIAIHTSHYPYTTEHSNYVCRGGERVAQAVAEGLAESGHKVVVYTASANSSSQSTQNGVEIKRYRSISHLGSTSVSPQQFIPVRESTDVVLAHNTTPPGVVSGLFHTKSVDVPLVVTHHGNDRYVPDGSLLKRAVDYLYTEQFLNGVLQQADAITIPSSAYLSESNRLNRVREKVIEIPNGIDINKYDKPESASEAEEAFGLASGDDVVVFVGSMIPKKGPDLLLKAAQNFDSNTSVVIAGSGPLLDDLRSTAPESVHLPGYISERDKIALLNRADVFCLPSRIHTEVFPLVLLEAYASTTPVVAGDLRTFSGLITERTGRRFERDNAAELASVTRELLSDQELREQLAANARLKVNQYQWCEIIARYESLFKKLLS